MKAEAFVNSCTIADAEELAWAVICRLGPGRMTELLRERFFVNGTHDECAAMCKQLEGVDMHSFALWAGDPPSDAKAQRIGKMLADGLAEGMRK